MLSGCWGVLDDGTSNFGALSLFEGCSGFIEGSLSLALGGSKAGLGWGFDLIVSV